MNNQPILTRTEWDCRDTFSWVYNKISSHPSHIRTDASRLENDEIEQHINKLGQYSLDVWTVFKKQQEILCFGGRINQIRA